MEKSAVKLRTIFLGTSEFAAELLESLVTNGYNIVSAYTQPDRKAGRDQDLKTSAVKNFCEKNKIKIYQPEKLDAAAKKEIEDQKPDLIILAAYGKIIPKSILDMPGFGSLNIHTSLLPKYRGPSPIQNAILNGETETGVTIILMDEKIDTGKILSQKTVAIEKDENAVELSKKMALAASELLAETLPLWAERKITPREQDDAKATICQLIEKSDGKLVWSDDAESIYNRYRAFTPWPGIFGFWEKDDSLKRIKLNKISLLKTSPKTKYHAGEIFQLGEDIGVHTGKSVVLLTEVQREGKESVKLGQYIKA